MPSVSPNKNSIKCATNFSSFDEATVSTAKDKASFSAELKAEAFSKCFKA